MLYESLAILSIAVDFDPFFHLTRENEVSWLEDSWQAKEAVVYDASLLRGVIRVNLDFVSFKLIATYHNYKLYQQSIL